MYYIEPAVRRIKEIKNAVLQNGKDVKLSNFNIEFKNVSFAYDNDTQVLKDVSFYSKSGRGYCSCRRIWFWKNIHFEIDIKIIRL